MENIRISSQWKKIKAAILLSSVLLAWSAASKAATIDATQTFSLATTNWNEVMSLELFDESLGDLLSINFALSGDVQGNAAYENEDAQPQEITLDLAAEIVAEAPAGLTGFSDLAVITPLASVVDNAGAYDGTRDFAGTSGNSFTNLSSSDSDDAFYDDNHALWDSFMKPFFTTDTPGTTVDIPIAASGESTGSGSGNLTTNFSTNASAALTVTYTYTAAPIPEPSSSVVLGFGALILAFVRRRPRRPGVNCPTAV